MGHDGYYYQREDMPETPGSRDIIKIVGDDAAIRRRGQDITALGDQMARAARTLEMFADGTIGRGESFQSVRDQAKEVHEDLSTAALRYKPSGEALVTYAAALGTVQQSTDSLVDNAAAAWATVNSTSRELDSVEGDQWQYDFDTNHDVETTGPRPSSASEQSAFDDAHGSFETYRLQYDAPVETWEAAYETAVTALEDTNADGISDGFWDNAMPFIEGLLAVLTVVGILLVIAAFVLTGPLALIAAALALVVGVITLLGEVARLHTGRGSWQEVGLAALGVIPFGKFAKLGDLASLAGTGARFPRLSGAIRLAGSEFIDARRAFNALDSIILSRVPEFATVGMNSRNLLRLIQGPAVIRAAWETTGSWGNGWRALAGFSPGTMPANLGEAVLGSAGAFAQGMGALMGGVTIAGWFGVK